MLFCPLADCRDEADLEATLVRALGVDRVEAIPPALEARPQLLLVLDNFEQLLAAAPAVLPWSSVAKTLVTSRAPLGLPQERVVEVRPLSMADATELFVRRSVRALSDDEGAELGPLLQALDCLPLAIELAAARTTLLRPADLLERLRQGRTVLKDSRQSAQPRHATLTATVAWSWELLTVLERATLAQDAGTIPTGCRHARATFFRGQLVYVTSVESTGEPHQRASNDLGATWETVELVSPPNVRHVQVASLPGNGGIVVAYVDRANHRMKVRVLQSAFQSLTDVPEVEVATLAVGDLAMSVDGNGVVWVFGRDADVLTADRYRGFVSVDLGQTFAPLDAFAYRTSNPELYVTNLVGAFCRGHFVLAHNAEVPGSTNREGDIGTLWAGGWSNLVGRSSPSATLVGPYTTSRSWGGLVAQPAVRFETHVPIELPANAGGSWSHVGVAAPTLEAPGVLQFRYTSNFGSARIDPLSGPGNPIVAGFSYRITSGTVDPTVSLRGGVALHVEDAVATYDLELRLGNRDAVLYDVGGARELAQFSVDNTTWHDWVVAIDERFGVVGAGVELWYRAALDSRWVRAYFSTNILAAGPGGAGLNRIDFGSLGAGTATLQFRHWFVGASKLGESLFNRGLEDQFGGFLSTLPVPVPGVGSESRAAFLSA
ncbi:MAG: hypothetical protein AAF211_18740, partial [Myxococcota bacterium]